MTYEEAVEKVVEEIKQSFSRDQDPLEAIKYAFEDVTGRECWVEPDPDSRVIRVKWSMPLEYVDIRFALRPEA